MGWRHSLAQKSVCRSSPKSMNTVSRGPLFIPGRKLPLTLIDHLISYTAHAQYSQVIDPHDFGHEAGRISTLATYSSNQSQQGAAPWSGLAVQYDEGQILPHGIDDQALSFPFEGCEVLSNPKKDPTSQLPSDDFSPPYQKPQHRDHGQNGREAADNILGADLGNSSTSRHCAASPATSTTSMNSAVSKIGRPLGSHLSEEERINAKEVRDRGACFRCWYMKEKVCNRNLYPNMKNWYRAWELSLGIVHAWTISLRQLPKAHTE
jgi:hypothetical protein